MFNSNVLEVGIGLVFTFLTVSLICGVLTETWATVMSWRSNGLLAGIKQLVNDPKLEGLALSLYNHALVSPRDAGTAKTGTELKNKPSYIDPKAFAQALLDAVAQGKATMAEIKTAIEANPIIASDPQLQQLFASMVAQAGDSVDKLKHDIGGWFDAAMDRVSGTYKRWTQLFCFGFGLVVAIGLNVDTLHVASVLWQHPDYAKTITQPASIPDAMTALDNYAAAHLPIGWSDASLRTLAEKGFWTSLCPWSDAWSNDRAGYFQRLIGWLLTAGSTLFGASFWFDALGNLIKLRGNGPAPEKKPAPATS